VTAGPKPILCYVTDGRALKPAPAPANPLLNDSIPLRLRLLLDSIGRAAAAGTDWIQIREKDLDTRPLVELVRLALAESRDTAARVLVNDRLDIAVAANAGGIHLGEKSLPLQSVVEWRSSTRRSHFLIGVSCHSLESAREAERGGADYIFFGPVYATPSKASFGPPQGIERLREICTALKIPVLAIGGVNLVNGSECISAGAAGVAAIRLFQDSADSAELAAKLKNFSSLQ